MATSCTVTGCTAEGNGSVGIIASGRGTIQGCTANRNTEDGIRALNSCQVIGNTAVTNGVSGGYGRGVAISDGGVAKGNYVKENDVGIWIGMNGGLAIGNVARDNTTDYDFIHGSKHGTIVDVSGPGTSEITSDNPWANIEY